MDDDEDEPMDGPEPEPLALPDALPIALVDESLPVSKPANSLTFTPFLDSPFLLTLLMLSGSCPLACTTLCHRQNAAAKFQDTKAAAGTKKLFKMMLGTDSEFVNKFFQARKYWDISIGQWTATGELAPAVSLRTVYPPDLTGFLSHHNILTSKSQALSCAY